MRSTYGLNIVYVRFSAIFSTPRCRYPITHSSPITFSPSSRKMTRSTPWVAGCCGPILMTSSFASRNVSSRVATCVSRLGGESVFGSVIDSLPALNPQIDLHPLTILLQNPVIFPQRMPLPTLRQQNAFQVRMPIKPDPKHVEDFSLQPIGRRPDRYGTRQALTVGNAGGHANALVPGKRIQHPDHIKLLLALRIMHGSDVHAVIELFFVPQDLQNRRDQ